MKTTKKYSSFYRPNPAVSTLPTDFRRRISSSGRTISVRYGIGFGVAERRSAIPFCGSAPQRSERRPHLETARPNRSATIPVDGWQARFRKSPAERGGATERPPEQPRRTAPSSDPYPQPYSEAGHPLRRLGSILCARRISSFSTLRIAKIAAILLKNAKSSRIGRTVATH